MIYKYPLAESNWGAEELDAIRDVIESNRYTMGDFVSNFESTFAQFLGTRHAVMVNSGSSANLLMIAALFYRNIGKLKAGDEVIVPAVSWSTTYFPIHQYHLRMKFVDIDLNTLNYDLDQLRDAVTEKTRVIFAVNLLGNPNDFKSIFEIIGDRDILLLEDNCESLGAEFAGRATGTFGLMGSFSTFFSHHISTMEGGFVVTDNDELYHILLSLRAHGWTRNLPKSNHITGEKNDDPFYESFHFVLPGYNLRPLEFSAAIGLRQLEKFPGALLTRRWNADRFLGYFKGTEAILVQSEIGSSSWFGFSVIINDKIIISREALRAVLDRLGIEHRPIVAGNFVKNPCMRYINYEIHRHLGNADYIHKNGLFIGNHHYRLEEMFELLYEGLVEIYR